MEDNQPIIKRESTFPLLSKYFITHPQDAVQHMGLMKKQMEDFIEAFKKRVDVELTYSKNLTQVGKSLDKYIKPGTQLATSFICSAFKVEHQMRSRQAFDLAESIKTEIEAVCAEMLKKETVFHKKMQKDVKRFYKQASGVEQDHRQALSRFEGINREMQEMIITKNIMRYTSGIPQQKKVKLISKTMQSIKENKEYQKLYTQAAKNYNKFASSYNTEITSQLNQQETFVRDQVSLQADCLRKLIVAQASLLKNIQYDIINISTQMQSLDSQKDIETFVEESKSNSNNLIVSNEKGDEQSKRNSIAESTQMLVQQKKFVGKSMLSNSLLYVDEEYFSWMLFNKRHKRLREVVAGIWKELNHRKPKEVQYVKTQNNNKEIQQGLEGRQNGHEVSKEQSPSQQMENKSSKKEQELNQPLMPDWSKQLRQLIQTFKVQSPPNGMSGEIQKTSASLTVETTFSTFMDIMRIISQFWNLDEEFQAQKVDNKLQTLQKYMSEHHLYRLIALMFLQQYRIELQVMIKNSNCAKMCSKVLRSILKESQKQGDTFIIRGILGLIFTFYWADDKHKRLIYLNPDVYQCDIWKKNDFWEAAIFETTYQEMALFTKQKGETPAQTILREKNIIFSQLASFCHYMVMLGITSKKVRLIVGRYCRLYEMTEEQNKDLSKMITNTTKQYKETVFQFSLKGPEKQKSIIND